MLRLLALICLFVATCQADTGSKIDEIDSYLFDNTQGGIAAGFVEAKRLLAEEKAKIKPDELSIRELEEMIRLEEPTCEWPSLEAIAYVDGQRSLGGLHPMQLILDEAHRKLTQTCREQVKSGLIVEKHRANVGEQNAKLAEGVGQVIVENLLGRNWNVEQLHRVLVPRLLFPKLGSAEQMELVYEELGRQTGESSELGEQLVQRHLVKACEVYADEHRFQFFGQTNFDRSFSPKVCEFANADLERQFYLSWATELICDYMVLRGFDED